MNVVRTAARKRVGPSQDPFGIDFFAQLASTSTDPPQKQDGTASYQDTTTLVTSSNRRQYIPCFNFSVEPTHSKWRPHILSPWAIVLKSGSRVRGARRAPRPRDAEADVPRQRQGASFFFSNLAFPSQKKPDNLKTNVSRNC